ncbi:MAG: acyl carrier protein [Clostridiales bacterium]|nr:acyl carrier protein [Clostridiales bacterium]HHX12158.1 acyl carrier protein [Clostridiales bacterium]
MDIIIEILKELHPEVNYETCNTLIDDKILDSFDIVTLISDLSEEFDITIPVEEIKAENFNSAKSLFEMVERLMDED